MKNAETHNEKNAADERVILADGVQLQLTHLNKIFWPEEKLTKNDVINYYDAVCNYILPYLRNRPQSLRRNPNGIADKGFFQKDMKESLPDWAKTVNLYSDSVHKNIHYFLCNDKVSLLFLANLGCIELNPWNSVTGSIDNPDYLIVDLDPSEENSFDEVVEVALTVKQISDEIKADSFCKTSGATGIHVYLPLGRKYSYGECRSFAKLFAEEVVKRTPAISTIERALDKREKNKIYIDYLQNKKGQTVAAPYSIRPRPGATVSAPLAWEEVQKGLLPAQFTIFNMLDRINQKGDLFKGVFGKAINLEKCLSRLKLT